MAELSLALQSAGSIPADLADRLILTTDKAWQMNGSVSELTRTLDGMYHITSQNSVNLDELSRGLSAISSRAASLGMDVDETAAALTAIPQPQEQQAPPWFQDSAKLRNLVCTGERVHHRS